MRTLCGEACASSPVWLQGGGCVACARCCGCGASRSVACSTRLQQSNSTREQTQGRHTRGKAARSATLLAPAAASLVRLSCIHSHHRPSTEACHTLSMASTAVQRSPSAEGGPQWQRDTQQQEGEEAAAAAPTVAPPQLGPRYQYQLLYSKSRVTLHPTPYSKDNIPGYLALLRRHKIRRQSVDSEASSSAGPSSQPLRRQFSTQDNSYDVMLSWLPEDLVKDRSETAKFVDVELREAEGASQRGEEETECTVMHSDSGKVLSMREVVENGERTVRMRAGSNSMNSTCSPHPSSQNPSSCNLPR